MQYILIDGLHNRDGRKYSRKYTVRTMILVL